ncbi:hypothetical protein [Methylobacterium hispanicum]|uniref:hypothetical protein n=1 Tax=Methylobacterium hispanicum TaxID=270350 RepID=UPI002F353779
MMRPTGPCSTERAARKASSEPAVAAPSTIGIAHQPKATAPAMVSGVQGITRSVAARKMPANATGPQTPRPALQAPKSRSHASTGSSRQSATVAATAPTTTNPSRRAPERTVEPPLSYSGSPPDAALTER